MTGLTGWEFSPERERVTGAVAILSTMSRPEITCPKMVENSLIIKTFLGQSQKVIGSNGRILGIESQGNVTSAGVENDDFN